MEYAVAVKTCAGYEWYGAHECSCVSDDELEEEEEFDEPGDLEEQHADNLSMMYGTL